MSLVWLTVVLSLGALGGESVALPGLIQSSHHSSEPALMQLDVGGSGGGTASLASIFTLTATMCGFLAVLWPIYWSMPVDSPRKENFKLGLLCTTWGATSIGMHVLNKSLETVLEAPALISIAQMVIAVCFVAPFAYKNMWDLFQADWRQIRTWLLVPLFFAGMLSSSFYTYSYISLSLLTVIRNLTPLVVLPIERLVMPADKQPHVSFGICVAILIMLVGAVIYAGGLKDISMVGVAFALCNMVLAVSDRTLQRRLLTNECKDIPSNVCTVLNNFFGMFPLFFLAGTTGQYARVRATGAEEWLEPRIAILLVMSGVVGIGICYIGFECQRQISATSFFVMQNVSKVGVVTCGVLFFGDPIKSPASGLGLLLSLSGSALYGKIQMDNADQVKLEKKKLLS